MYRVLLVCLALGLSTPVLATPITGELIGAGLWEYGEVEAESEDTVYDFGTGIVLRSSGDFSGLFLVQAGDITLNSIATSTDWIIGAYLFVVDKVSISGSGSWVDIVLRGWLSENSQNTLTQNEPTRFALGISTNPDSYSFTTNVPEPGSVALISIGLIGLILMRRKKVYVA